MKNALSTIILTIFMLLLLVVVGLGILVVIQEINGDHNIVIALENNINITEEGSSETVNAELTTTSVGSSSSTIEENTSYTNTSNRYYYNQLNDTEKKLYNGLVQSKENMVNGVYTVQYGDAFSDILSQENGKKILGEYYQSAIDAYIHDNPDLFYLDISKLYLNIETTKRTFSTTYKVFLAPQENQNYYNDNFTSEEQVRSAIKQVEEERDKILARLKGNDYDDIKIIHDYLVDEVKYDEDYESKGTYTIYGALVEKKCVCEGYARAFKYLTKYAGIDCVLVQGKATNSSGKVESHAWNAVFIDNNWYYIDTTWDDPIIIGNGYVSDKVKYKYFLKGSDTFDKDHTPENQFSDDGKEFSYPDISKYDY